MDLNDEVYVTSRSRTPSVIEVNSQTQHVFTKLPDLIQEATLSTEFSSPRIQISRIQNSRVMNSEFLTTPIFTVRPRTDSGVDLPDLTVTDEKIIEKYGSDLTANFADIRVYGAKAFYQRENASNNTKYSLCVCATGYIWVYVAPISTMFQREVPFSDLKVQIGTFALKARAITTIEATCGYKFSDLNDDHKDGQLALLCATVLAKYLRLRMIGKQYEEAAEFAIKESRKELSSLRIVNPDKFDDLHALLRNVDDHEEMAMLEREFNPAKTIFPTSTHPAMLQNFSSRFH